MEYTLKLSKELSRQNLSCVIEGVALQTFWFRVAIREQKTFMNKAHAHSFYEIHLCLEGNAVFVFDGKETVLTKGNFIFIPKHTTHQINSISDDFVKIVLGYDLQAENEKKNETSGVLGIYKELREFQNRPYTDEAILCFDMLMKNLNEKPFDYFWFMKLQLHCMILELTRCLMDKKTVHSGEAGLLNTRMDNITPYITDNLSNGVTVTEIARQFAISEKQLSRICYREHGVSAGYYIRSLQFEKAKELLAEMQLSLDEVASRVGYSDQFSFSKAFKMYEGLSPSAFRQSLLK